MLLMQGLWSSRYCKCGTEYLGVPRLRQYYIVLQTEHSLCNETVATGIGNNVYRVATDYEPEVDYKYEAVKRI